MIRGLDATIAKSRLNLRIFIYALEGGAIRESPIVSNFAQSSPWQEASLGRRRTSGEAGRNLVADRPSWGTRWSLYVRVDMEPSNYRECSPPADASAWPDGQLLIDLDAGRALAQAIVDTVRDPLLVLDQDLRVVTANRAFHQTFRMNLQDIQGRPVYGLGNGQWDIPELRLLLENVVSPTIVKVCWPRKEFMRSPKLKGPSSEDTVF